MERNISEEPEKWVIIKLPNNDYKVFGTWAGGYLDGDRWKLNSGIKEVEQDENYYYFIGYSGSCYKCHKNGYGFATSYGSNILNGLLENATVEVELMEDVSDWTKIIK